MSMQLKLILLLTFLFLTAIGNSLFTFQLKSYEDEKLAWVTHTNEVMLHGERLMSSLKDAETGQRGYLLTDDTSYLVPYYIGVEQSKSYFSTLKQLTSDNSNQQIRLEQIHTLITAKFTELANTIELQQSQRDSQALLVVKNNEGKQYMDEIRILLTAFNNEEQILLEQRKGDFKASRARIDTLILIQLVIFFSLAIATFLFLNKNLFQPLKVLLHSTQKTERGEALDIIDIVSNDEMGYLLSRFFSMSKKIQHRTEVLTHQIHHDELTGLKNRCAIFDDIKESIALAKTEHNKLAIFFIDLNDFKIINDTLGHEIGDKVLQAVAARIQSAARIDDSAYRIGGDEFVVLIKNINTEVEITNIAEKILQTVEAELIIEQHNINIMLSIGVAVAPDASDNNLEILKFADIAMYAAKNDPNTHFKRFDHTMLKRISDKK